MRERCSSSPVLSSFWAASGAAPATSLSSERLRLPALWLFLPVVLDGWKAAGCWPKGCTWGSFCIQNRHCQRTDLETLLVPIMRSPFLLCLSQH